MKPYIKTDSGLCDTSERIQVFKTKAELDACAKAGCLLEGEVFSTVTSCGYFEDLVDKLYCLIKVTPSTATESNQLVTNADLDSVSGDASKIKHLCFSCGSGTTYNVICDISTTCNVVLSPNAWNVNASISTADYPGACCMGTVVATDLCPLVQDISCRACCADVVTNTCFATTVSHLQGSIQDNANDISDLYSCPGLNCTGTVTSTEMTTAINTALADYVTTTTLASCGYTTCTGTVVASDIADMVTHANLSSCGYTTCTGTVTTTEMTTAISNALSGYVTSTSLATTLADYATTSAIADMVTHTDLASCGYTTCTGTVTASDLASYGKVKTISVNNGTALSPDTNGNIDLSIPSQVSITVNGTTCTGSTIDLTSLIQDMIDACMGVLPTSQPSSANAIWVE